jgi:hypothetical protein
MYRAVISFLLLLLLVGSVIAANPRARQEATDLWEEARPTVVDWKDKAIEILLSFILGRVDAQIDHDPVPPPREIELLIVFRQASVLQN